MFGLQIPKLINVNTTMMLTNSFLIAIMLRDTIKKFTTILLNGTITFYKEKCCMFETVRKSVRQYRS